jgi:hypothetical protein
MLKFAKIYFLKLCQDKAAQARAAELALVAPPTLVQKEVVGPNSGQPDPDATVMLPEDKVPKTELFPLKI